MILGTVRPPYSPHSSHLPSYYSLPGLISNIQQVNIHPITKEDPSTDFCHTFSVKFTPICYYDPQSPAILAIQNSDSLSLAQQDNCILFGCCLPLLQIGKGFQEENKGNYYGAYFACLLSLNNQSLALSVQYLKAVDEYIFPSFIIVYGRKDSPVLVTQS